MDRMKTPKQFPLMGPSMQPVPHAVGHYHHQEHLGRHRPFMRPHGIHGPFMPVQHIPQGHRKGKSQHRRQHALNENHKDGVLSHLTSVGPPGEPVWPPSFQHRNQNGPQSHRNIGGQIQIHIHVLQNHVYHNPQGQHERVRSISNQASHAFASCERGSGAAGAER